MLKPYLETEGTDTEYRLDLQQALNYGTADIWGQIVLCCGGCLVRHPRPLPTRCQEAPPPVVTTGNVSVGMKSAEEKEDVTKGNNGLHVPLSPIHVLKFWFPAWRCWAVGPSGGTLTSGFSVLPAELPVPSSMGAAVRSQPSAAQKSPPQDDPAGTLILDFQPPECEKQILLLIATYW